MKKLLALLVLAAASTAANATTVAFSGSMSYVPNQYFPVGYFPDTFTALMEYGEAALTDVAAIRTIDLYLGPAHFNRSLNETQPITVTTIGPHSVTYLDPNSGSGPIPELGTDAATNAFEVRFFFDPSDPAFDRSTVDFDQAVGGTVFIALRYVSVSPEVIHSGAGLRGTITDVTVVPEPATLALFGAGLFGIALSRRRSKGIKALHQREMK